MERQREDLLGQIGELEARIAELNNAIISADLSILQLEKEFREAVLAELVSAQAEVSSLVQQVAATQATLTRTEVRSPLNGIVHQLQVTTRGAVVPDGGVLMQIVPVDDVLDIEAAVAPQFIDNIYQGQPVRVVFSGLNRNVPELSGTISAVSPKEVSDRQSGERIYRIRASLDEEARSRLQEFKLLPGMPVTVFITTKDRTPLAYLLQPLADQLDRALREE